MTILAYAIVVLTLLILVPSLLFCLQVVLAIPRFKQKQQQLRIVRPSVAILVPAHNEAAGITATLNSILPQLNADDRLLVVADNCSDSTEKVAIAAGAEVVSRVDKDLLGKGYALDYGVRHLKATNPPQILIVIDADCHVEAGAIDMLALHCFWFNRPIQALYLMQASLKANLKSKIAEFAWATKNYARPLGYRRIGLPCQLMGTGMAFPWWLIQNATLATGNIVEDLALGLDLADQGYAPRFCDEAVVTSIFPANNQGIESQRKRWEHGHLAMIVKQAPSLLLKGLSKANIGLVALVLDMCIPPLALLTILVCSTIAIAALYAGVSGQALPWVFVVSPLVCLLIGVFAAWYRVGRSLLTFPQLAYAPVYALGKLPLYFKFFIQRQVEWVRSSRES